MSRPLRIQYPDAWYHVMNRGRRGEKVTRRGYFNEPRNVAVYLIRHLRNDTLKHAGEQFGIEKYSIISSIVERVKNEMKTDKGLENRTKKVS